MIIKQYPEPLFSLSLYYLPNSIDSYSFPHKKAIPNYFHLWVII
jgi:hypothetical protein